jgi:hypothetical protein
MLVLTLLFDLGADFDVFTDNITRLLRTHFCKGGNFNTEKKGATSSTTFQMKVDFGAFNKKIWHFKAIVLILRS